MDECEFEFDEINEETNEEKTQKLDGKNTQKFDDKYTRKHQKSIIIPINPIFYRDKGLNYYLTIDKVNKMKQKKFYSHNDIY